MSKIDYPSNWQVKKLKKLAAISIGGTPPRETSKYWAGENEEGYIWVSIADMKKRCIDFSKEKITSLGVKNSNVSVVPKGQLIMSFKLSIGRIAYASCNLFTNEAIASFKIDDSKIDTDFLYYQLPVATSTSIQDSAIKGATLNKEKLGNLEIPFPYCKITQQKIAKVLSTIDNQIEQTQALIEKYTAIKQGLMSDLFSRGIDVNTGKLRPSYQQAPELYWESELGWIPKGWNAPLLDKFAKRNSGHTPAKTISEYWNGGIKWVSLADSNKLDKLYITATSFEVSQLGIQNSSAIELPKGTVILSRDAGIGKSAILAKRMAVSQHFMAWTCKKSSSNLFLYYWLQNMKPVFEQVAMGSTIPTIGLDFFKRLQIACPDNIEEQKNIGLKLKELDLLIFKFKNEKQKSQSQKQGLMQDLLTGKKSVDSLPDNILTPTSSSQAITQL